MCWVMPLNDLRKTPVGLWFYVLLVSLTFQCYGKCSFYELQRNNHFSYEKYLLRFASVLQNQLLIPLISKPSPICTLVFSYELIDNYKYAPDSPLYSQAPSFFSSNKLQDGAFLWQPNLIPFTAQPGKGVRFLAYYSHLTSVAAVLTKRRKDLQVASHEWFEIAEIFGAMALDVLLLCDLSISGKIVNQARLWNQGSQLIGGVPVVCK